MELLVKGATYRYKKRDCVLADIQIEDGVATLHLDFNDEADFVKKDWADYEKWIHEFALVKLPASQLPAPVMGADVNNLITQIRDKLLSDIDRVRADKAYIPQAKQACNTTNTLLNLVKLEIKMKGGRV